MNTRYRKYPWRRRLKSRWPHRLLLLALAGLLSGLVYARRGEVQVEPVCGPGGGFPADGGNAYVTPPPVNAAAVIDAVYRAEPGQTACRTQRSDGAAAWTY
ncbi:hypothetical protein HC024_00400 [Methylococcaceae bacterium WWC4]|nr:hypothetical protein [Methylococcaceae bacterium WWC4]